METNFVGGSKCLWVRWATAAFLVLCGVLSAPEASAQTRDCPYCNGTGRMVKNITVSQYGVDKEIKVRCRECGIYYYPSTGHTHIHCKYCGGTGKRGSASGSSSSSSSSDDLYDPTSPLAAWGREVANTLMYGLPVSQEEDAAFKSFAQSNPEGAKKYVAWRNVVNSMAVYCNRCRALLTTTTVQNLDQIYLNTQKQINECSSGVLLPDELYAIVIRLSEELHAAYLAYRKYCAAQQSLDELKDRVLDWQLQQNMFY